MAYVIFYQFAQPLFASVRLFGELLYNFIFPFPELQLIFRWFVVFIFSFTDGIFPEFIAKVFNMLFNFCSMFAVYYAIFLQQKIKYRNTTHTWFNFLFTHSWFIPCKSNSTQFLRTRGNHDDLECTIHSTSLSSQSCSFIRWDGDAYCNV